MIGGLIAWFASAHPDGLEWSIRKIVGSEELPGASEGLSGRLSRIQEKTAPFADYYIGEVQPETGEPDAAGTAQAEEEVWPEVSAGRSLSGVVGSLIVLAVVCFIAFILSGIRSRGLRTGGEGSRCASSMRAVSIGTPIWTVSFIVWTRGPRCWPRWSSSSRS